MVGRADEAVMLTEEESGLVAQELQALLPSLQQQRREAYEALARAASERRVPAETAPALEGLIALALHTGRARRLYEAEGERILTDLFRRTARGQALEKNVAEVNGALAQLTGRPLGHVRIAMRTLGHFTLSLETDQASVTLALRPDGVAVESVSVADAGV